MGSNRYQFYFTVAIIVILATAGFVMLEITNTITDLALIEVSFYNVVRNGDIRLSAEINRGIQDTDLEVLEEGFKNIDSEINNL